MKVQVKVYPFKTPSSAASNQDEYQGDKVVYEQYVEDLDIAQLALFLNNKKDLRKE